MHYEWRVSQAILLCWSWPDKEAKYGRGKIRVLPLLKAPDRFPYSGRLISSIDSFDRCWLSCPLPGVQLNATEITQSDSKGIAT